LIGGAIIGPAVGLIAGCKLIGPARALNWSPLGTLGRLLVSLIGGGVLIFFYAVERNV
jgi:hypothetical protein